MLGKVADVIAHEHFARAVGSSVVAAGCAHELRPQDMKKVLSVNTI